MGQSRADRRKVRTGQQTLPALGVSVILVEGLLLLLLVLHTLINEERTAVSAFNLYALGTFGVFALASRFTPVLSALPDVRVTLECFAMIALITVIVLQEGIPDSRLTNLYLLPVMTSALTLGRRETAGMFIAVITCRLLLSKSLGITLFDAGYFVNLFIELSPLLLLAVAVSALVYSAQVARGQVRALTYQDELTGLFNMRAFSRLLNSQYREAKEAGSDQFVVLKVNVNDMRNINERHGFETGNEVLIQVARSLQRSTRISDMIARYGGDEFVILLRKADKKLAKVIMNRIHQNLYDTSIPVGNRMFKPSVAVGAATYPVDGDDTRSVMAAAEKAMEQNKCFQKNLAVGHAKADVIRSASETTLS